MTPRGSSTWIVALLCMGCAGGTADSDAPPMLLVCSEKRGDDPCGAARRFSSRAATLDVRTSVLPQDLTHGAISGDLGLPGDYTDAVERFMKSVLR